MSFSTFLDKRRAIKYPLQELNLFFYMYIFSLMSPSVYLFRKTAAYITGYVFAYFCGEHKNNFWLQFRSSFK